MKITRHEFKQTFGGSLSNLTQNAARGGKDAPKQAKYRNIKTEVDGIIFDSKREASRYLELRILEKKEEIHFLEVQPSFTLQVEGQKICKYIGDFSYYVNGELKVEDVKSAFTRKNPVYRLKKKLMKAVFGIEIIEV